MLALVGPRLISLFEAHGGSGCAGGGRTVDTITITIIVINSGGEGGVLLSLPLLRLQCIDVTVAEEELGFELLEVDLAVD